MSADPLQKRLMLGLVSDLCSDQDCLRSSSVKWKFFTVILDIQEKAAGHLEYKPLYHSPYGTLISLCISERKLLISLMLTDTSNWPSACIISDLRQSPITDYPENKIGKVVGPLHAPLDFSNFRGPAEKN